MKTSEQINQLKQVSIIEYLSGKGINPVSKNGNGYLYHSPLRKDSNPSFSVSTTLNVFNDFGNDSDKGSIIDLVMKLEKVSFLQACEILEGMDDKREKEGENSLSLSYRQTSNNTQPASYEITAIKRLQHPALIRYLTSRKISLQTAFNYLNEIHYSNEKGKFFGLGYQNDSGGYVLRSEIMKKPNNLGNAGIKTFSVPNSKSFSLFEGMFDFLSAIEYYQRKPNCTAIILNSVSNLSKAMLQIQDTATIYSFLDNDNAGRTANIKLKQAGFNLIDKSNIYEGFKDFNEFMILKEIDKKVNILPEKPP